MSLLKREVLPRLKEGSYNAIVKSYEEVVLREEDAIKLVLELDDVENGIKRKEVAYISERRLDYIARDLQKQFQIDFINIEDMLNHASNNTFFVTYTETEQYGPQFQYR